jgi:hypothetical protein
MVFISTFLRAYRFVAPLLDHRLPTLPLMRLNGDFVGFESSKCSTAFVDKRKRGLWKSKQKTASPDPVLVTMRPRELRPALRAMIIRMGTGERGR